MPGLRGAFADVLLFHQRAGLTVNRLPTLPSQEDIELRKKLIREEVGELLYALDAGDLIKIADGIADVCYVALGTGVVCGINAGDVWEEVHSNNLTKIGGPRRADGKVLKPTWWTPPNVVAVLKRQEPIVG